MGGGEDYRSEYEKELQISVSCFYLCYKNAFELKFVQYKNIFKGYLKNPCDGQSKAWCIRDKQELWKAQTESQQSSTAQGEHRM